MKFNFFSFLFLCAIFIIFNEERERGTNTHNTKLNRFNLTRRSIAGDSSYSDTVQHRTRRITTFRNHPDSNSTIEPLQTLPPPFHLSHSALSFLNHKFPTATVLADSPNFVSELQIQCSELDRALSELTRRLGAGLAAYASFSGEIHSLFDGVNNKLHELSATCSSGIVPGLIHASIL
jgi:hypothetical protein